MEFTRDVKLGIAGGVLYIVQDGKYVPELNPEYHVRGAIKMYRRECLQQIGDLHPYIGWDTIDEVYAWVHNWNTRTFPQCRVTHRRPTGNGKSAKAIWCQRGKAEYYTWSHPLFVVGKALKRGLQLRSLVQPIAFLSGFIGCYFKREDRLDDSNFVHERRRQQLRRMLRLGRV